MRPFARCAVPLLLFSALALADSWTGTVIDIMCKDKEPAAHAKACAIKCSESGYGLVLSDGTFLKFDDAGNGKALEALRATEKQKDLKAEVSGTLTDGTIKVESIKIGE
jgi:hypothetical protein